MSIKKAWALLVCVLALLGSGAHAANTAEVTRGIAWLQGVVAADGSVTSEAGSVASTAQVRTEVARTLRELGSGSSANLLAGITPDTEPSTEIASRTVLAVAPGDAAGAPWLAALVARRLPDGSVPAFVDQGTTDVDMAWALRALTSRPDVGVPLARFLASRQQPNGSWTTAPYSPLNSTALALCGLSAYASTDAVAGQAATTASSYLAAQRQGDGGWSSSVWLTAQVYECLHDYLPNADDHIGMRAWLLARQSADGSWGQDPFVTSLALRALALTDVPPLNPSQAGLRVRIIDSQTGVALPGIAVALAGSASRSGATDASGVFQQSALPPGAYQLTASHSGYASVSVALNLKAGVLADVGMLRMSRSSTDGATTASVGGVVVDASTSQALPGVLVSVAGAGKSAVTDGQGRYNIDAIAPGAYSISATKAGYSSAATSFSAAAGGSYTFSPRLPLTATGGDDSTGCRIYGKLLKATGGSPVAGASIALSGANSKVAASDATGSYVLSGLVSGSTTIRVTATGYDTVQAAAVLSCNAPAATEFSPRLYATATSPADANTATLTFVVVDSATSLPLAGVAAQVSAAGQSARGFVSAADGRVVVDKLPLASVQMQLSLAGYDVTTVGVTIAAAQPLDVGAVPMRRSKSAVVTGLVSQASTGAPLQGASVVLSGATSAQATTDSAGRFMLAGLAAGEHTLTVSKAGFVSTSSTFSASPGGEYIVSPRLRSTTGEGEPVACRLSGKITAAQGGAPISGSQITLTGTNAVATTTDATGAYSLDGLISGDTRVVVSANGFDGAMFDFRLGCVRPNSIDFSPKLFPAGQSPVDANTASISFTLLDAAKGTPLVGVPVTATTQGQAPRIFTTAANGRFKVTGLKQAEVRLQAAVAGYEPLDLSFQVTPLADVDMGELRLRPAGNSPLLPDLRILSVSRAAALSDAQSLLLAGTVQAVVVNQGLAPTDRAVTLLAFEDRNRNGRYDPDVDVVLGQATLPDLLAVGASAAVGIPVKGSLLFRDAPIHVWVDSAQVVAETDETNNVKSTADAAAIQPSPGSLTPELKWHWKGSAAYPGSRQVESGILVVRTHDTNGDGRVDQADTPSVAFITYDRTDLNLTQGTLRIVDGQTGDDRVSIRSPGGVPLSGWPGFAAADVLHEGPPVFFIPTRDGQIAAVKVDGTLLWKSQIPASPYDGQPYGNGPSVADLYGNGHPVVMAGRHVLDAQTGRLLWSGTGSKTGAGFGMGAYDADLLGDGQRKVIVGPSVYNADGSLLWQRADLGDGPTAVADFSGDGNPRIVLSAGPYLYMLDRFGKTIWGPVYIGGSGAPPVIADLDGDGVPDIGIAGSSRYFALRADGSVMWSVPIKDSSGKTGSTAFDFDGDGHAEIVYADEVTVHIYDGKTGTELFSLPHSNATAGEMPVVADIDNDGHADLLIASDTYYGGAFEGVRAFRGTGNSWVNARSVWNQYAYSITNVNDDLTIPVMPSASWATHNTFRVNKRLDVSPNAVSDATVSFARVIDSGGTQPSTITVRIGNGGALTMPSGVKVAFYAGAPGSGQVLGVAATTIALAAGAYEDVSLQLSAALAGYASVTVVVDDDGTGKTRLTDFDRSNNALQVDVASLATALKLSLATDVSSYRANQAALFTAAVANAGSFVKTARVRYLIQTADGQPVTTLPIGSPLSVASGATNLDQASWNVGATYAGIYRVSADLLDAASERVLASASASFTVEAGTSPGAPLLTATLQLGKGSYNAGETVRIAERLSNLAPNQSLSTVTLEVIVINPDGSQRWSVSTLVDELAAGGLRELGHALSLGSAPPGNYSVRLSAKDASGTLLASDAKSFSVRSSAVSGAGLTGALEAAPKPVPQGDVVSLSFAVQNQGNDALANVPLFVRVVDPTANQLIAELPVSSGPLQRGGSFASAANWTANAAVGSTLVAVLVADVGGKAVTLAQDTITVTAPKDHLSITSSIGAETRLLVLISCPPVANSGIANCLNVRSTAVQTVLSTIGVPYKIVTSTAEFQTELRCGTYNAYWLSTSSLPLDDGLIKELREAVRRGEGLILDGAHDPRNARLLALAGVTYKSRFSSVDQAVTLNAGGLFGGGVLASRGLATRFELAGGTSEARFDSGDAAIVSRAWGAGNSLLFAFDLVDTLIRPGPSASAPQQLQDVLARSTKRLASTPPAATVGDVLAVSARVSNDGTRSASVELRAELPVGLRFIGASVAPISAMPAGAQPGLVVWRFTLAAAEHRDLLIRVVPDRTDMAATLPLTAYGVSAAGDATLLASSAQPLQLLPGAPLIQSALDQVRNLAPAQQSDVDARNRAVNAIQQAQAAQQQGSHAAALQSLLAAADELDSMTSAPSEALKAAQAAIAWALEAASDVQCGQAACLGGRADFFSPVPPASLPMGDTLQWGRTVSNACPAGMSSISVSAKLRLRRTGGVLLSLDDNFTLAGNSANDRQSVWQAKSPAQSGDDIDAELTAVWQGLSLPLARATVRVAAPRAP